MSTVESTPLTTAVALPVAQPAPLPAVSRVPATPVKKFLGTVLTRTVPVLVYQLNRVGRSGAAGTALILFAGIFFFAAVLPQNQQLAAIRQEIVRAQHHGVTDASPHVRLNRFLDKLPKRSEIPVIVGQIFKLAAIAGVTLDRGLYEMTPLHSGHLAQYRMSFPIKGHYPDIRHFIDAILSTVPSAAVESLRIERKAIGDANVSADLRFSLFVRNES